MNIENIKAVRDLIASLPPERFDMSSLAVTSHGKQVGADYLEHTCGTAGCIAGWAIVLRAKAEGIAPANVAHMDAYDAGRWLGLGDNATTRYALFTPEGFLRPGRYSQADAIATLDHLIETGEVKWPETSGAV